MDLGVRSSALGAVRRPRKPSSSADHVRSFEESQVFGLSRRDASTSWLTADARMNHRVNAAETGPPRTTGFPSTDTGSRPGRADHAKVLSGSKSTPSRIT